MRREAGFTLIELFFSLATISILAGLMLATFKALHTRAGFAVNQQTIHDGKLAFSAAMIQPEDHTSEISYQQDIPGELSDAVARELLPGFRVPINTEIRILYSPSCTGAGELSLIIAKHCKADRYTTWTRFCDGSEILAEAPGTETKCSA